MNGARAFRNAVFLLFVQTCVCAGQDATTPGELRADSTPQSISVEWDLAGDREISLNGLDGLYPDDVYDVFME